MDVALGVGTNRYHGVWISDYALTKICSLTMAKKRFAENKNYVKPYLTLSDFYKKWSEAKVYCVDGWVWKLLNSSNFFAVESN